MRHEMKKIGRIVDELTTLFLNEDTNEIDLKILTNQTETIITLKDYQTRFKLDEIKRLEDMLNQQRQREIEEYYWQLAGETDEGDELVLVSAMIDEAKLELIDGNLFMTLIRRY
jgi:hypothetical protein